MLDPFTAARISPEAFARLGASRVAYVKSIRSEEAAFLCAEAPLLAPGNRVFVLHAADGTPIVLAATRESAVEVASSRRIETLSLH